jgi:hypothetical protein
LTTTTAPDAEGGTASAWVREATRLHERYVVEVVERYGFCPWATRARQDGRLRVDVSLQVDPDGLDRPLAALERWSRDDGMEVGFLLFPRLALGRVDFDRYTSDVRSADSRRYEVGSAPFAMVGFHPEAKATLDDAERIIPFLRRTPDPCIQVIRLSVLERVRGSVPEGTQFVDLHLLEQAANAPVTLSVRDRVGLANLDTVRTEGVAEIARSMEDIHRDREATYRRLQGPT